MNINEIVKRNIKKKCTIKELSQKLGLNYVGLIQTLGDSNNIRIDTLQRIANALGVSIVDLLTEDDHDKNYTCPHCGMPLHVRIE